jgi:hypothetical protein
MQDTLDSVLHHNFHQQLPKSISDKVLITLESLKDKDGKGMDWSKTKKKPSMTVTRNIPIGDSKKARLFQRYFTRNRNDVLRLKMANKSA